MSFPQVKVAAAHVAPIYLDKQSTTQKAISLIGEAAKNGAQLIAFPESFIPGFPVWASLWAPIYNHDWFKRMAANSILIDGPEMSSIRAAAKQFGIVISLGFSEASPISVGCLWNSNVIIGDDGEILVHHRKLVPTFYEKLVWASGDGYGLRVAKTKIGKIGALICGENTNPLARFAMAAEGEQIHISAWPAIWPTRKPGSQNFDNVSANRIRAGGVSFENKVFGILCSGFMDKNMFDILSKDADSHALEVLEKSPRAATMFLDPTGATIGDVLQHQEGLAYAQFDLNECVEPKQFHDIVGYYNRFDVFDLKINRTRISPAKFSDVDTQLFNVFNQESGNSYDQSDSLSD
jgi:aliphatic nitrilase